MRPISEIKANPKQFIGLTSLKLDEFENILSVFVPLWENYYKHHDLKGANRKLPKFKEDIRSSLFGTELKLFFLLYCLILLWHFGKSVNISFSLLVSYF